MRLAATIPAVAIASILPCLLPGCGGGDSGGPAAPDAARTSVYVANFSAETILEVYLRPAGGAEWGVNRLTAPIGGGNLYAYVGQVVSGVFDARMVGQATTQETLGLDLVGSAIGISFQAPPAAPAGGSQP